MTQQPFRPTSASPLGAGYAAWAVVALSLALSACVSHSVRTVDMTPPEQLEMAQSEDELLDIGIAIFDPNVPEDYDLQIEELIQPEIRRAEANYIPYFAKNLLQSTGNWGAVRVVPRHTHAVDVIVGGKILHSDGESMGVEVTVTDATGAHWFTKSYEALASKYAYDPSIPQDIDPFQSVYKQLADDMLAHRKTLSAEQVLAIRRTAEMKFAQDFSPDAFSDHVGSPKDGEYEVTRLPANDDPMLARVRKIREREYLFIDTLDEYYENFHRDMFTPYQAWRHATYEEAIALKQLKIQARNRTIGGTAAIIAGIAALTESGDPYVSTSGLVSIIGGAVTLKSAFAKRAEASIHAEVLQEVGVAAEAEIMPHTLDLENQTVRLQGTVDEQYEELRGILREIYFADLGLPVPPEAEPVEAP
jgi:hypothetical protein